jgi:hypothetical protein
VFNIVYLVLRNHLVYTLTAWHKAKQREKCLLIVGYGKQRPVVASGGFYLVLHTFGFG